MGAIAGSAFGIVFFVALFAAYSWSQSKNTQSETQRPESHGDDATDETTAKCQSLSKDACAVSGPPSPFIIKGDHTAAGLVLPATTQAVLVQQEQRMGMISAELVPPEPPTISDPAPVPVLASEPVPVPVPSASEHLVEYFA